MGPSSGESLRVSGMGSGEPTGWRSDAFLGQAVMHVGGRQQAEA